jgi:hypothetical protein
MLIIAALLSVLKLVLSEYPDGFAFDFRGTIWQAGGDILGGRSPYPMPQADQLLQQGNPVVYPPPILLVASPLHLLPVWLAAAIWDVAMAGCLAGALRLVGVRDRRVLAAVFFAYPFTASLALGQIDSLLALGLAAVWRYRDQARIAATATAVVVAVKLFLWPLSFWLILTGRRRAAVWSVVGAATLMLVSWAIIGFRGLREYPHLLASLSTAFEGRGYSAVATGLRAGLSVGASRSLALVVGAILLAACVWLARIRRAESRALVAAVAAGTFSPPIVWMHSVVVLLVALAIIWPEFSWVWLVPLALWVTQTEPPSFGRLVFGQIVIAVLIASALRSPGRQAFFTCTTSNETRLRESN